jgi:hypothetical protein
MDLMVIYCGSLTLLKVTWNDGSETQHQIIMNIFNTRNQKKKPSDIETRIPLIEERLNVSKRTSASEATITKEPVTKTRL